MRACHTLILWLTKPMSRYNPKEKKRKNNVGSDFLSDEGEGARNQPPTHRRSYNLHPVLLLRVTMSFWDALTSRKSPTASSPPSNSPPSSTSSPQPTHDSLDGFATSTTFDPSSAQDVSSFLGTPSLPDPSRLHPLAGLDEDTLDYITLEESVLSDLPGSRSALPSRGWSDDLCYGTGVTYLTALSIGGAWGLAEGINRLPPSAPPKLRLNSILNSVTRRGPFLGNSAGVLAMVYNGINSFIGHYRGKHDAANSVAAGALSGMLFKSTRGLRPMMISGGLVAGAAGAWAVRLVHFFRR